VSPPFSRWQPWPAFAPCSSCLLRQVRRQHRGCAATVSASASRRARDLVPAIAASAVLNPTPPGASPAPSITPINARNGASAPAKPAALNG
jgi:hypothetical protein